MNWFQLLMEAVQAAPTITEGFKLIEDELTSKDPTGEKAVKIVEEGTTVLQNVLANTPHASTQS